MADPVLRALTLSGGAAHALALAGMTTDLLARSWRIRIMTQGAGTPLSLRHSLAFTAFGDAAAILTPWRAGGEVARVIGARASRVSLTTIVAVLTVETLIVYAIAAIAGAWLVAEFGRAWMERTGGATVSLRAIYWIAVATLLALTVLMEVPALRRQLWRGIEALKRAFATARRIPSSALAWCVALSVVALAGRLVVLPALVLLLPDAPSLGVLTLVSFTVIHGQIAMPTPGGAGPIELAFLKGGIGVNEGSGALLGWWRLYATLLPAVFGVCIGAATYGRQVLQALRWSRKTETADPSLRSG